MFDPGLFNAIEERKPFHGKLDLPQEMYPDWNQMIPFWDNQIRGGWARSENPLHIMSPLLPSDFPIVQSVKHHVYDQLKNVSDFTTDCYAGITPNARAFGVHQDKEEVLFVMIQGTVPWKMFEDGYDHNSRNNKSTFSRRLFQGEYVYVPSMLPHAAFPDDSRIAFSFGWYRVPEIG